MSAYSWLRQANYQIGLIVEDIELDLDEGLDHKCAYTASVIMELRNRVDKLLADSESKDWDLSEDDIIDKRRDKVIEEFGMSKDQYDAMTAAELVYRNERDQ